MILMARFKFRLESVLNIKQKVEDLKKNEFGKAMAQLAMAKQKKVEMINERASCIEGFRQDIDRAIDPTSFAQYNLYIDRLKGLIIKQDMVIEKANLFAEKKRQELVEAMRDKKTLETLKENEYNEFIIEEKKEEQKMIDEVVSYRNSKG